MWAGLLPLLLLNGLLTLAALALNLFWLAVLIHGHRYFSTKFFFIVSRHLLIADLLSVVTQLLVVLPGIGMADSPELGHYYAELRIVEFLLTCEALAQLASFHFVGLQALGHVHNLLLFHKNDVAIFRLNSVGTFVCILVWMWLAVLLLYFGISHCAKRFSPALLYLYDSCFSEHSPKGGGHAVLDIWLAVLLFLVLVIYLIGLWTFYRKIRLVHPAANRPRRNSLASVSVIQQQSLQQQPPSIQSQVPSPTAPKTANASRKLLMEMFKSRVSLMKGLYMALSLALRFVGFYLLPWIAVSAFGSGVQAVGPRATTNLLGNALILLSLCAHPLIYWYWNARVRVHADEVRLFLWYKLRHR